MKYESVQLARAGKSYSSALRQFTRPRNIKLTDEWLNYQSAEWPGEKYHAHSRARHAQCKEVGRCCKPGVSDVGNSGNLGWVSVGSVRRTITHFDTPHNLIARWFDIEFERQYTSVSGGARQSPAPQQKAWSYR